MKVIPSFSGFSKQPACRQPDSHSWFLAANAFAQYNISLFFFQPVNKN